MRFDRVGFDRVGFDRVGFDAVAAEGLSGVRSAVRRSVIAAALAFAVGGALVVVTKLTDVEARVLVKEPQAVGGLEWYTGFLSTLGVLVWVGGVAAVVALALTSPRANGRSAYLAASGVALAMALDDIYLLHDDVYPVQESVVQLLYFVAICAVLLRFRAVLPTAAVFGSVVAMGCWVASAGVDRRFNHSSLNFDQLTEDSLKFCGILVWTVGWVAAGAALHRSSGPQRAT